MTVAAVVLAAGGGSRFEGPGHKLLTEFRGHPLVWWPLTAAIGSGLDEVAVVVGAVELEAAIPVGIHVIENSHWASGQASSLQAAVSWVIQRGHQALVVGLGDQPLVPSSAWAAVAASDSPIAVATFGGQRLPPVRLDRSIWKLLPTTGDEGARILMRARPDLVCEVPCEGEPADIDDEESLTRWS